MKDYSLQPRGLVPKGETFPETPFQAVPGPLPEPLRGGSLERFIIVTNDIDDISSFVLMIALA